MSKHTPGPWEINWYYCRMDKDDVAHAHKEGNTNAKVGDVLWRAPTQIGPCYSEHSHWGGDLLTVEEADARLIAAAPELLALVKRYRAETPLGHQPHMIAHEADAVIAKVTGEQQ